jgi:hypothetical protein
VKAKIAHLASLTAHKYNLTLHAYDDIIASSSIMLSAPVFLDPAPVTPTSVSSISAWGVLSGTTRAQYGKEVIMAPGLMTGNTDTRFYWDLTRDIFRYGPGWSDDAGVSSISLQLFARELFEVSNIFQDFLMFLTFLNILSCCRANELGRMLWVAFILLMRRLV